MVLADDGSATANAASLQLARAAGRRRELAIRSALGAARGRLVRQAIVENLLLALLGGAAGLILAALMHRALPALFPAGFPRVDDIGLGWPIQAFALDARFDYETEMLIIASRKGFKIASVPISTVYSDEVSSIHPMRDTLRFFKLMRRYKKL